MIRYLDVDGNLVEEEIDQGSGAINWCLRENPSWSNNGINRNNSTVQKSWAIIQPYLTNLPMSSALL